MQICSLHPAADELSLCMQCIISRSWSDDREHRPGFTELRGILSDCLAAVKADAV